MSRIEPVVEDYLRLFDCYAEDIGALYKEPEDDRYAFLFAQVVQLLIRPSPFNRALPAQFRRTAQLWHRGDPATLAHMSQAANQHFMLCDLHDLVMLKGGLARRRAGVSHE